MGNNALRESYELSVFPCGGVSALPPSPHDLRRAPMPKRRKSPHVPRNPFSEAVDLGADGPAQPKREWVSMTVPGDGSMAASRRRMVRKRVRSPALRLLRGDLIDAADAYAAAFEQVHAGGVGRTRFMAEHGTMLGRPEGRQAKALDAADVLSRFDRAVSRVSGVTVGTRFPERRTVAFAAIDIVRVTVVDGKGLSDLLALHDLKPTRARVGALARALCDALERVAAMRQEKPQNCLDR